MPETNGTTNLRDLIEEMNREMAGCLLRGDLQGYAAYYADEATIIGFDKRKIRGREAINQFCLSMTDIKKVTIEVLDVGASGNFIYQVGTSLSTWEKADGESGSYFCDFMYLWRKEENNTYRIFLDAYN